MVGSRQEPATSHQPPTTNSSIQRLSLNLRAFDLACTGEERLALRIVKIHDDGTHDFHARTIEEEVGEMGCGGGAQKNLC